MPYVENILSHEDVQWIMAKESLIRAGEAVPEGAFITSNWISPIYVIYGSRLSDSATERYSISNAGHNAYRRRDLGRAYSKVAAQIQQANIGDDYPRVEEPIEETGFVYPQDNVISIRKGRSLNRRG